MGFGKLASFLVLALFFRILVCQTLNTDEFFVFEFLQKMGLNSPQNHGFSGSFCSWKGVTCDEKGERVVKLEVSGLGLSGSVPEITLGKLVKIESLDLSNNKITGLPSDFWSLGLLKSLNLSFNLISGRFSSNVVDFVNIQSIDLSFNNFSGSVPGEISSLTSLQVLNLSHNGFETVSFLQCRSLVSVDLSANKLNGIFPNGFSDDAFPSLRFLNLAENGLTGRDSDFAGLNLKYLNISRNFYKGSVVGIFEGPLEVIDLSRNQFQGHIGQVNFSSAFNWSNLVYLDLSENEFSGEFVSTDLSLAQNLRHLNLANNRFNKLEFLQVDMLTNLEYLNLSGTDLIGEIPRNISSLRSLRVLDLSDNHLENHIPPLFLTNLKVLDLSQNNLTGVIPITLIQELNEMERFNFSYNNLSFCASQFSNETLQMAFVGSLNSCPIAAIPTLLHRKPSKHRGLKLALVLSLSIICLLVGLLFFAFGCRRKTRMLAVKQDSNKEEQFISGPFSFQTDSTTWVADVKQPVSVPVIIFEKPLLNFTFADLLAATSHFDRETLLAEGRFGPVYGGLLPGGLHVAVKVLVHGSTMTDEEAARELEYLGRIRYPNLVPLTGYCLAGDQRIAIYDYMENGNLQNLLYESPLGVQTMEEWTSDTWDDGSDGIQNVGSEEALTNWAFRCKIALGTARALAFLHHGCSPPIIHRDVKASSVYLDLNLEPRLSDFGIAKIFGNGVEEDITRGSPGYVPPELLNQENNSPKAATPKYDVYGFGVVLFELITGKKPVGNDLPEENEGNLVSWVRGLVKKNEGLQAIDPKIRGTGPDNQIVEALKIGYLCTADVPSKRPSMQQVVGLLKDLEPSNLLN